ncbi:lasso peptide biosynthesis B2 protein [Sphingopyxis sp. 22461]|uniref:lasso peptide biosynthesis B2 protein n=1 Tax=Sphingopyxis sp. 22461 TaxID=3453923 RepID=UPI003F825812
MSANLAPWISYCKVEDCTIILDVRANRYFMATEALARALENSEHSALPGNLRDNFLRSDEAHQSYSTACGNIPAALEHSAEAGPTSPAMPSILTAIAIILSMRFQLRAFSLDRNLQKVQRNNRECLEGKSGGNLGDLISAFECAERLTVERDRCLLRSLALQSFLAKYGHVSALVFGVRLHPFRAHCWLQQDATVLNDTIEVIGSFQALRTVA